MNTGAAGRDSATLELQSGDLIPAVIQDAESGSVIMVGFMNAEALERNVETGRTHFFSRSRQKLWRKGETSGHEQIVEDIFVNCELNSLLITVRQIGAGCHEGYPTCYFRRLEPDGTLTVVRDRWFDPTTVYASGNDTQVTFETLTRLWFGAYEYLRDVDLSESSSTSKRLHSSAPELEHRVADEIDELAAVLAGTHVHRGMPEDVILEGSQSLYWLALIAVQARVSWEQFRPDRALISASERLSTASVVKLLSSEAASWKSAPTSNVDLGARCHAAAALVAQACLVANVAPAELIRHDLAELRGRPYLLPYFESSK